jgi:proteasome lid subunit RPN8/RPN11
MAARALQLDADVAGIIRRHGEETFPHECCGALIGIAGESSGPSDGVVIASVTRVTAAVPLPNTTEEGPRRRFLVRPADYRLAEARASELGGELLGFYHSHPDHPARPSQFDLDHAWPNFAYVIVSVMSGVSRLMTVWFLKEDRSSFDEGDLNGDENPDPDPAAAVHG